MSSPTKICIVGSGNWGSVIAKIIGNNVRGKSNFAQEVTMYVYEEIVDGQKLTEIINSKHENVKYLPGHKLPENVIAVPDVVEAAKDCDILVFVVPHQFVRPLCQSLLGKVKPGAVAISLIKGLDMTEKGGLDLISNVIRKQLGIECAVLMGANVAPEVASEMFCEATIGCRNKQLCAVMKEVFQTPYFRIVTVDDEEVVELCGALKNIVANAAGISSGLGFGSNTTAAVVRLGLMEMIKFSKLLYPNTKIDTFLESCGVADLITTSYTGRNRRVAEVFAKSDKTIEELEKEMLNGQKLQGPPTAAEVNAMLKAKNMEDQYPLFTITHRILTRQVAPEAFIESLRNHPEHM